ncbi:MAG: nuclear transport factor 2 family protein, partial [Ferruginibacter sp.]|nr:nuclear transport factor 2 family protein [Cytophagales bacterium]
PNGPPGVVLSAEQFMSRWRAWLDGLGVTQHGLAAKHIAVYEIEATCFVDALITSCPDQENALQWGGQFWFVFVHQADAWRITKLDIAPLWITDSPEAPPVLAHLRALLALVSG